MFSTLMIQSNFTHKTQRCIKLIDEFGVFKNVTNAKICDYLEVKSFYPFFIGITSVVIEALEI